LAANNLLLTKLKVLIVTKTEKIILNNELRALVERAELAAPTSFVSLQDFICVLWELGSDIANTDLEQRYYKLMGTL
jgi:hypothetical protein